MAEWECIINQPGTTLSVARNYKQSIEGTILAHTLLNRLFQCPVGPDPSGARIVRIWVVVLGRQNGLLDPRQKVGGWYMGRLYRACSFSSHTPGTPGTHGASPTPAGTGKRLNARKIVEEQLKAFELVLEEAGNRTKAIMAQA